MCFSEARSCTHWAVLMAGSHPQGGRCLPGVRSGGIWNTSGYLQMWESPFAIQEICILSLGLLASFADRFQWSSDISH